MYMHTVVSLVNLIPSYHIWLKIIIERVSIYFIVEAFQCNLKHFNNNNKNAKGKLHEWKQE